LKRKIKILPFFLLLACPKIIFGQGSDSLKIDYNYVNSSPQNAEVYINSELTGSTPLHFKWADSLFPKQMKIKLKGFADYFENITGYTLINKTVSLIPVGNYSKVNPVKEDKASYFGRPRKVVPIVISSLFAAGAGLCAYYFKSLAIENRDFYEDFGDQSSLDRKKKYDIISGVSLAVFQLGLGVLVYFLFID
jgi:hypothetical protein